MRALTNSARKSLFGDVPENDSWLDESKLRNLNGKPSCKVSKERYPRLSRFKIGDKTSTLGWCLHNQHVTRLMIQS